MYTVENGKIVNTSGVELSLEDAVLMLNGAELTQEDTEPVQADYESEYSSNWQSYAESTSYGRGNW